MRTFFGSKKLVISSAVFVGLLLVLALSVRNNTPAPKHNSFYPESLGLTAPCPGKTEFINLVDPYLPGKIEPGQSVKVIWNWYACHPPKAGEIALVRISRDLAPKAKVIRAVSGDSLVLKEDASKGRWNLFVNHQPILDYQNVNYAFGGKTLPPIGRYIEAQGALLGPRNVVVLSTRSPGEFDSGAFGVVGIDDLVAKVERE